MDEIKRGRGKHTGKGEHEPWASSPIQQDYKNKAADINLLDFMDAIDELSLIAYDKGNIDELNKRFAEYKALCRQHKIRPGNQTIYAALAIDDSTVYQWANCISNGQPSPNPTPTQQAKCEFIKRVKRYMAGNRENLVLHGKINPVSGIHHQKFYDGVRDDLVILNDATPNPLGATRSPEQIIAELEAISGKK